MVQSQQNLKSIMEFQKGSCLGPLLFLVYINDSPICLEKCTSKLYADDTDISVYDKSVKEAEK